MKKKILFLYLNTGAGHISSARSIADCLNTNYSDTHETQLVNGFEETNKIVKYMIEDGYRISQAKAKWAFEFLYALNKCKPIAQFYSFLVSIFVKKYLKKILLAEKPDTVAVLHFFLNKPILDLVKELKLKTKVLTVVTDPFTAPLVWFLRKEHHFVIFSDRVKNELIKRGFKEEKLKAFPYILNKKFSTPASEDEIKALRDKHGFSQDKKIILLLSGGDGIPKGSSIIKHLLSSDIDAEFALVCGRNKKMFDTANQIIQQHNLQNVKVFGFVDFVFDLTNIANIVITKGGPATVMEILLSQKIPVISSYIWEQEKGNMEFVVKNHLGVYETNPAKIPQVIKNLNSNPDQFNLFLSNIKALNLRNGTQEVAEYIKDF